MSPRTKESNLKIREETKRKIEQSAVTLFSRKGLSVTISEIAGHAGVSQGLLYQYYDSKESLIGSLVRYAVSVSGETVKSIFESGMTAKEKIKMISSMMINMLQSPEQEGSKLFLFMIQIGMNTSPETYLSADLAESSKPIDYLVQIITAGQAESCVKAGSPVSLAVMYWAAVQGLCCFSLTGVPLCVDESLLSGILLA